MPNLSESKQALQIQRTSTANQQDQWNQKRQPTSNTILRSSK